MGVPLRFVTVSDRQSTNCPSFVDRDVLMRYIGGGVGHADRIFGRGDAGMDEDQMGLGDDADDEEEEKTM
jgi:hypothetical protein